MLKNINDPLPNDRSALLYVRDTMVASEFWNESEREVVSPALAGWLSLTRTLSSEIGKNVTRIAYDSNFNIVNASSLAEIIAYAEDALTNGPPHYFRPSADTLLSPGLSREERYIAHCERSSSVISEIARLAANVSAALGFLKTAASQTYDPALNPKSEVEAEKINILDYARRALVAPGGVYSAPQGDFSYAWATECESPAHFITTLWAGSVMNALKSNPHFRDASQKSEDSYGRSGYHDFYTAVRRPLAIGPSISPTMNPRLLARGSKAVLTDMALRAIRRDDVNSLPEAEYFLCKDGNDGFQTGQMLPMQVLQMAGIFLAVNQTAQMRSDRFVEEYSDFFGRVANNENLRQIYDVFCDACQPRMNELNTQALPPDMNSQDSQAHDDNATPPHP